MRIEAYDWALVAGIQEICRWAIRSRSLGDSSRKIIHGVGLKNTCTFPREYEICPKNFTPNRLVNDSTKIKYYMNNNKQPAIKIFNSIIFKLVTALRICQYKSENRKIILNEFLTFKFNMTVSIKRSV